MRYIEVIVNTPQELLEQRCDEMTGMGVGGFVIENEADFQDFLENNRQYWDYVDSELEKQYAGISRIKCYLTDDTDGQNSLRQIRAAYGEVTVSFVEDSDWENNWREFYQPIPVGERLIVVPAWEENPDIEATSLTLTRSSVKRRFASRILTDRAYFPRLFPKTFLKAERSEVDDTPTALASSAAESGFSMLSSMRRSAFARYGGSTG